MNYDNRVCSMCLAVRVLILGSGVLLCLRCDYVPVESAGPPTPSARLRRL
jgi:hypothetical protein